MTPPAQTATGRFGVLWRRLPARLGYLLLNFPIALAAFVTAITLFALGVSLLIVWVGIPILVTTFTLARSWATLELRLLAQTGTVIEPADVPPATGNIFRVLGTQVRDVHRWAALAHMAVVAPIIATFTWCITITWLALILGGLSFGPVNALFFGNSLTIMSGFEGVPGMEAVAAAIAEPVIGAVIGLGLAAVALLTLPALSAGLVHLHALGDTLLGRFPSDALRAEVADLERSRSSAARAESTELRRLERDIDDGPQQRLLRIQMDLAAAQRSLAADPAQAATLLAEARDHTGAALTELRALSRGMTPPLLQDRGLAAELESIAALSTVPTSVTNRVADALPPELELGLYFVASELMTNVARHSGASAASIVLEPNGRELWLTVSDNGSGGAQAVAGHGLAGIADRVAGLRGTLTLHSPDGGPTHIRVVVPAPIG